MNISISDDVSDVILEEGYNPKYGARPLRKTIQRLIENPLADNYLMGKYKEGSNINVYVCDKKIIID